MTTTTLKIDESINKTVVVKKSIVPFLREAFRLIGPFWLREKKFYAWAYSLTIFVFMLSQVAIAAKLSFVYADMIDRLSEINIRGFIDQAALYFGFVIITLLLSMGLTHARGMLIIHWREWLTDRYSQKYMSNNLFNQLELKNYNADNPDQRISMDILTLCEDTLSLFISFTDNLWRLTTFIAILWVVSGTLDFTFMGIDFHIPGYLFWVALIQAILATWIAHMVGKPLTGLENERQTVEADFRFQLIRIRENAESMALIGGEAEEIRTLRRLFEEIWSNWWRWVKSTMYVFAFQSFLLRTARIFPILAALPAYLSGNTSFGGLLQLERAYMSVFNCLIWFVKSYQKLAAWRASVDRVLLLEASLDDALEDQRTSEFEFAKTDVPILSVRDMTICLPDGKVLLEKANFDLQAGCNVIITGTSGSGKSTLFRVLSGLWVWGKGEISYPVGTVMFIPQKPYLPITSLRSALAYPHPENTFGDAELLTAMQHCHLADFSDRLDEVENWSRVLSGGEQQRVAFVRALLARPDWLFLDEASSALDKNTQGALYNILNDYLPETTIVSIAHRQSLLRYHDRHLHLDAKTKSVIFRPLKSRT